MSKPAFANALIDWYVNNHRELPWRNTTDPYKIWLSEIILQQTRVMQGLPYYQKFVETFPTVQSLAQAEEKAVLRLWQGLGYYSRARNLHKCARTIVNEHYGKFPSTFQSLQRLPGIGPYTAAAIASFAFNEAVPVIDGNVFRVLARVFGIEDDIAGHDARSVFFAKASQLIDPDRPGDFNQAIMELGATCCTPANPRCVECPLQKICVARRHEIQHLLPVKSKKTTVRKRYLHYFVIKHRQKILLRHRTGKDIWQDLYDFYCIETKRSVNPEKIIQSDPRLKNVLVKKISKPLKHVLSHQWLLACFYEATVRPGHTIRLEKDYRWVPVSQLAEWPKPILIHNYLKQQGLVT